MNVHHVNRELGTDEELAELVNRIRGFDFDHATDKENMALARALRVLADDTVRRHDRVRHLESELKRKLILAEVTQELSEVARQIRPKRWWRR